MKCDRDKCDGILRFCDVIGAGHRAKGDWMLSSGDVIWTRVMGCCSYNITYGKGVGIYLYKSISSYIQLITYNA